MDTDELVDSVKALLRGDGRAAIALYEYTQQHPVEATYLVSSLRAALSNVQTRDYAAFALAEIGPDACMAVPELIEALKYDPENFKATPFALALGRIGPLAKNAVPALIAALATEDTADDIFIAEALGRIRPAAAIAIPALKSLVDRTDDPDVREAAIVAINQISAE